ncbi:MAG: S9 family peptidase [Kofleriaceae bacterium]
MRRVLLFVLLFACSSARDASRPAPPFTAPTVAAPAPATREDGPPIAKVVPHALTSPHGAPRNDPYYWLRDDTRTNKDVIAYLDAENAYAEKVLAPSAKLADTLFTEMRSRLKEDDASVPTLDEGYWYYSRYETGKQYPIHCRRKGAMTAPEEVLLDGNALAQGHAFYKIGTYDVSRDGRMLAYVEDTVGRNQFVLRIKDLKTGALLPDTASNLAPSLAWANDNKTLFFATKDPVTLREDKLLRLAIGERAATVVYEEKDVEYSVDVGTTKSRAHIVVSLESLDGAETRLIDANKPGSAARMVVPREPGHIYSLDHLDGRFVIRTNDRAKNYRVVEASDATVGDRAKWKDIVAHDTNVFVEDVAVYRSFLAVGVRTGGLAKVRVLPKTGAPFLIDAQDPAYMMTVWDTPDASAKRVRYSYSAMNTPSSVFELDVATKKRELLKQQSVPGYDASLYASEYLHATAGDGTKVPISITYRKGTKLDGTAPLLVYGYGSYGASIEPVFSSPRVCLLDRGWVYAIAHVRGGQEMGRAWYDGGKLMNKKNTFTDFIAVTDHLVQNQYGAKGRVFASGASAGGLLVGVIVNVRPDLYRAVIADVAYVDAITTMTDVSIPLTTSEFVEWGNPIEDKAAYDYILSYSPYDNVKAQAYPAMLVRTGLWDSQVQYFEPAKWVAKLRATKTDANTLVLVTDMKSGHSGASGRFDNLRETAEEYAFLLQMNDEPDRRAR